MAHEARDFGSFQGPLPLKSVLMKKGIADVVKTHGI
jgi:hypothetical protein